MPRVIELFVDQFIAFDQGIPASNPQGHAVFQTLVLTDSAKNYRSFHSAEQTLFIGQSVTLRRSVYNISVSQYMPLYQRGGNGPELQVITQFFWIGQEAKVVEFEQLVHTLSISQSVSVLVSKIATNTLSMTDAASCNIVKTIEVAHTLYIGSSGTGYLLDEESYSIQLPTLTGPNAPEC